MPGASRVRVTEEKSQRDHIVSIGTLPVQPLAMGIENQFSGWTTITLGLTAVGDSLG
jgi:hypothetical protein